MAERRTFHLLYASQTGTAQSIAEEMVMIADDEHLDADLHSLQEHALVHHLITSKPARGTSICAVFIVSTTGEGDPPDDSVAFFRKLNATLRAGTLDLSHVHYCILALGDSNRSDFCKPGKSLDSLLSTAGAARFYATVFADDDDAELMSATVDKWRDGLWLPLGRALHRPLDPAVALSKPEVARAVQSNVKNAQSEPNHASLVQNGQSPAEKENRPPLAMPPHRKENGTIRQPMSTMSKESPSTTPRAKVNYAVPKLSKEFLCISYDKKKVRNCGLRESTWPLECVKDSLPSVGNVIPMRLVAFQRLTGSGAARTAYEIELRLAHEEQYSVFCYQPGDTIGIVSPNPPEEVDAFLQRLRVIENADDVYQLDIIDSAVGKLPRHIPQSSTLRNVLTHNVDIRASPSKALVRALADLTDDELNRDQLLYWCSKSGSKAYTDEIVKEHASTLDLLMRFKEIEIRPERLLEFLPKLQPRQFSIASSPLRHGARTIRLAFNLECFGKRNATDKRCKHGIATGYLYRLMQSLQSLLADGDLRCLSCDSIADELFRQRRLYDDDSLNDKPDEEALDMVHPLISVYLRRSQGFRLPDYDMWRPMIFIATGTGIAPMIGFLDHLSRIRYNNPLAYIGETWLFFGSRNREHDFIYKDALSRYVDEGILNTLDAVFSRDQNDESSTEPKYVQHLLAEKADAVRQWIVDELAHVFVCGDLAKMGIGLRETVVSIIAGNDSSSMQRTEAKEYLNKMVLEKRYCQDLWS